MPDSSADKEAVDPYAQERVLAAVQRAWRGRPDVSLATLFGILANEGVGWGTPDEVLIAALERMHLRYPSELEVAAGKAVARVQVLTTRGKVTLDPWRVILRTIGEHTSPAVWSYSQIISARVGVALRISDVSGISHDLGVVERLEVLDPEPREHVDDISGLHRSALQDQVYLLALESGELIELDHRLRVFKTQRRHVEMQTAAWQKVQQGVAGLELTIDNTKYGTLRHILTCA